MQSDQTTRGGHYNICLSPELKDSPAYYRPTTNVDSPPVFRFTPLS